jgi:hypothetical protein
LPTPTTGIVEEGCAAGRGNKAFKSILGLFEGCAIGADLPEAKGTVRLLNAVTEYVDHQRGGDDPAVIGLVRQRRGAQERCLAQKDRGLTNAGA